MGIPGFFKWLVDKDHYPDIIKTCVEYRPFFDEYGVYQTIDETQPNPNQIEFDNLYLDMTGIIHSSSNSNNYLQTKNEDEIIKSIFDCIDRVFSIVRPRKLLYMAIDGVAPRAKLNQQRSRRFRELKDSLDKAKEIAEKKSKLLTEGCVLPDDLKTEPFNENCITPGTSFMIHLSNCLRYYIYNRMNTNQAWRSIKVILSDANVPGEGEHKIINYIRQQRTELSYNSNTHHVIFGTDADLILLGVATHEQYITIMRDGLNPPKPRFCDICQQFGHDFKECKGISKEKPDQSHSLPLNPIKTKYIFVDLSILRDRLFESLLNNTQSNFKWNRKRFLDDWVFICLLVGNDFLPNLPSFEIYQNVIDNLLTIYAQNVLQYRNYLTDNGRLNLEFFKSILIIFGKDEDKIFKNRHKINQEWLNNNQSLNTLTKSSINIDEIKAQHQKPLPTQFKPSYSFRPTNPSMNKPTNAKGSSHQTQPLNSSPLIPSHSQQIDQTKQEISDLSTSNQQKHHDPNDTVRLWEEGWYERYYKNKFNKDKDHLDEYRKELVENYTRGLCWVLQYYYHGVPSWDWYYPYHYAPFASDFTYLGNISVEFNNDLKPFKPLEQLISLLPPQYAKYLPEKWQRLVLEKDSPISDFYPSNFSIDPNGKRYKSDYTVVLPFINEERLHIVLEDYYSTLTSEENKRNEIGNDLLFIHIKNPDYNRLRHNLDVNSTEIIPIGKSIKAPIINYKNITDNQVMCVKYH